MALKFDQQKTKHQLFHLSIGLATILVCMAYCQLRRIRWSQLASFYQSLIVPIVFLGEILKVILARYYGRIGDGELNTKQKAKKASYFTLKEITGEYEYFSIMQISFDKKVYLF